MPAKRSIRSFNNQQNNRFYNDFVSGTTHTRMFKAEISHGKHEVMGLDSEVTLGKGDLEKLGYPNRIKVVIYNIDD